MNRLRVHSSGYAGPPFLAVKLFSQSVGVAIGPCRARTVVESGCGLSHESAQDGCNDTCVKLGASNPT